VAQKLGDAGIIHTIQEQAQVAGGHLKSAAADASKAVTGKALVQPEKPKKRGLLIVGVIAAAVAAGVAAWKASKPVEDPWKTPAPVTPAPSTPEGSAPVAETPAPVPAATVSESAAGSAATAESTDEEGDKAKHVAEDPEGSAGTVPTDAKTAVKNIAANMENGANKPAGT
jgi:cytoskeletal protein RodZ